MKGKFYTILLISILCIFLTSCMGKNTDKNSESKLYQMKSYSCNAEITVYGNKQNSTYKVKQYCMQPDKVRIETLEPNFLKGKVSIYTNGSWYINHALINQKQMYTSDNNIDELVNLGIVVKKLFCESGAKKTMEQFNGKEYSKIQVMIPGNNQFRKTVVLYIDPREYYPVYMEILDDKNEKQVEVKYSNFIYDADIESSKFDMN